MNSICVIGAGTMGSGIAQTAAQNGFNTLLFDINIEVVEKVKAAINKSLGFLVSKEKITSAEKDAIQNRIQFITNIQQCRADVIIEAIVEKTEAKVSVFNQLAAINKSDTIFASNTSSLSISDIQSKLNNPQQVVGMHFFNPAQVMKLVEVVKGKQTSEVVAQKIYNLCLQMKKTPVMCKDAPGFIVNRVARHYYLEAMKLVEKNIASIENADEIMEASGFKMGPFKLMDLIGNDINLAVSQSLYDAFNQAQRFTPSPLQVQKVKQGQLGKKTGEGFYKYN
ncbi:MAG: 3-hydroxybutyryl-CoA dehydrogenase [Ferruginibacter sp.]|nr:3-hydroxybutyryl-CoA dehydrogenase [Ferruginibacter sp.]